jgi:hypothetical protein
LANDGGEREAVRERLAERGDIRSHTRQRLVATRAQPKAELDLIEDEHGA